MSDDLLAADIRQLTICCEVEGFDKYLKRVLEDRRAAYDNLTSVQTRCTELIQENRKLLKQLTELATAELRIRNALEHKLRPPKELVEEATLVLKGTSVSYVHAAEHFARFILEATT